MGKARIPVGGSGLYVTIESNLDKRADEFKQIRREINRDIDRIVIAAGEATTLPRARQLAPSFVAPSLTIRRGGRRKTAVLTSRMRASGKGSAVGLLEFGGVVRTRITPKHNREGHAPALMTPHGPRAVVKGPRHYKAKRFMRRAIDQTLQRYADRVRDDLFRHFG
jgi:hypothetical protein